MLGNLESHIHQNQFKIGQRLKYKSWYNKLHRQKHRNYYFVKEAPESFLEWESVIYDTESTGTLILDFQSPNSENKIILFISYPVCGILP